MGCAFLNRHYLDLRVYLFPLPLGEGLGEGIKEFV